MNAAKPFPSPLEGRLARTAESLHADWPMRERRGKAAGLIRLHLWQPRPPGPTRDGRAWTMDRELDVWAILARYTAPDALNGAIVHLRPLTGARGPVRMTWFIRRGRGPQLLERAVSAWQKSLLPPTLPTTRGGDFCRLAATLPAFIPPPFHPSTEVRP